MAFVRGAWLIMDIVFMLVFIAGGVVGFFLGFWVWCTLPTQVPVEEKPTEKQRRIYYQDIVYQVCSVLDGLEGRNLIKGDLIICGTVEQPSTEVQDVAKKLAGIQVTKEAALWRRVLAWVDCDEFRSITINSANADFDGPEQCMEFCFWAGDDQKCSTVSGDSREECIEKIESVKI